MLSGLLSQQKFRTKNLKLMPASVIYWLACISPMQEVPGSNPTRRETIDFFVDYFFMFLPKIPVEARVQTTTFGHNMV